MRAEISSKEDDQHHYAEGLRDANQKFKDYKAHIQELEHQLAERDTFTKELVHSVRSKEKDSGNEELQMEVV